MNIETKEVETPRVPKRAPYPTYRLDEHEASARLVLVSVIVVTVVWVGVLLYLARELLLRLTE